MKIQSLKGMCLVGATMLMLTSCHLNNNHSEGGDSGMKESVKPADSTNEMSTQFDGVIRLEKRADFLSHEGDIDSAIACYKRSASLCNPLVKSADSAKNIVYAKELARLYLSIGSLYDSIHKNDSAIPYFANGLKWAKLSNDYDLIVMSNFDFTIMYSKAGLENKVSPGERKKLYSIGVKYGESASRLMDSLGWQLNKGRLEIYAANLIMYKELGDSDRKRFYEKRFYDLEGKLNNSNR